MPLDERFKNPKAYNIYMAKNELTEEIFKGLKWVMVGILLLLLNKILTLIILFNFGGGR